MIKKPFEEAIQLQDPFEKAVSEQLLPTFGYSEFAPGRVERNPARRTEKILVEMIDTNSILPKQTYIKQKSGRSRKRGPRGKK